MGAVRPPQRVLIVCLGNICRSPTAEVVLRVQAHAANLAIEFASAGTENYHLGEPPDPRTIAHARRRGYDLSALRARQVSAEDFVHFDLLLAADVAVFAELTRRCPPPERHRIALFLGDRSLLNPYDGPAEDFEKVLDLVEKQAFLFISRWRGEH